MWISYKIKILKLHYNKLGFLNLVIFIIQRLFVKKDGLIKVRVIGYKYPLYLRNVPSDTQIFTQIFLREELKINLDKPPKTIIDGGANIGMASLYLSHHYPDAKIFSIEPDYNNFEMLKKNTASYKNIICYNNGIWNKITRLKITNSNAGNESFIVAEVALEEAGNNFINAITINEIVRTNNIKKIGLLKLDIEGSEQNVFEKNFIEWLSITDNMLVEIHNWINKDAEKTVMSATQNIFKIKMAGEYHFFQKK